MFDFNMENGTFYNIPFFLELSIGIEMTMRR